MKCLIRGCDFQAENLLLFARHLRKHHKLTSKQYTIQYLFDGIVPKCNICEMETRYFSFSFKRYCKYHSYLAESEGGKLGGRNKKTWNKGLTKEDERINKILLNRKYNIEKYMKEIEIFLNKECGICELIKKNNIMFVPGYNFKLLYNNLYKVAFEKVGKKYLRDITFIENQNEIRSFHIFSDEWENKKDIIKSMIRYGLKNTDRIYARKCKCEVLDKKSTEIFFNKTHISGNTQFTVAFGLKYNGEIVSVLSLRKMIKKKYGNCIEIARFSSKLNTVVSGGFSKLLKCAKKWAKENKYEKILSYADLRFGEGKVYEKNGFDFIGVTDVNYWYSDGMKRFSRQKFRANLKENKSEKQIAEENDVFRVYGCGSNIYLLNLENTS